MVDFPWMIERYHFQQYKEEIPAPWDSARLCPKFLELGFQHFSTDRTSIVDFCGRKAMPEVKTLLRKLSAPLRITELTFILSYI